MAYQILVCNAGNNYQLDCHYAVNEESANELISVELDTFCFHWLKYAKSFERKVTHTEEVKSTGQLVQTYNAKGDDGAFVIFQFVRPLHKFEGYYRIFHGNYTKVVIKVKEVDDKLVESVYEGDSDAIRT